jgi:D-arabinose 1-dehydrogenase-like Zn-dependent alcohol dehydrogenase
MYRQSMTEYAAPLEPTTAATPVPKGTEVLVRISHCGVCHSDIHMHDGYFDLGGGKHLDVRSGRTLPFTLGHEIAGHVEAVGAGVIGLAAGAACAVYPWIGCGECQRCKAGDEHLCDKPRHLGINVDGGYASHVIAPHPRHIIDISGIAPELAGSLMCSGITAYGALKKGEPWLGAGPLLLVGLGGVGMMGLEIALAKYDVPVIAADISPEKRAAALAAGAAQVFDPADPEARRSLLKTVGAASVAVDFVGSEASLNFAQSAVGKACAVVVAGLMGGRFSLPVPMFALRQLAILGTFVASPGDARDLVTLVQSGKVKPIPVALRPLAEANGALADLRAGGIIGRVVLTP